MASEPQAAGATACARHQDVQTFLRCSRCDVPICPRCLVQTPVGARCPECARPTRIRQGSLFRQVLGAAAGMGVGMAVGGLVLLVPLGPLAPLAFLAPLLGAVLVGEAVWAVSDRTRTRAMSTAAFVGASVGPVIGRALVLALLIPLGDAPLRLTLAFSHSVQSMGLLGLLMLVVAGAIASSRVR